ncbi:MAG: PPC domain-containing protein [Magnetospirillum sp.]|nr:PPC domain-containing protein [Magnetospirillum sp.]
MMMANAWNLRRGDLLNDKETEGSFSVESRSLSELQAYLGSTQSSTASVVTESAASTLTADQPGEAAGLTPTPGIGTYNAQIGSAANASLINAARQSYIARPNGLYNLGAMFSVNGAAGNAPAYLSVTVYDRDAYGGKESYNYGTLTATNGMVTKAGGYTLNFAKVGNQYQTANGLSLSDFTFSASTQEDRVANIAMYAYDAKGTVLTSRNVEVVTHATVVDSTPGLITAGEIAKVAQSMIGKVWDASGCWNLASDIAATSGASLGINSGWISPAVGANGQWNVAYSGYNGVNANWMNNLQAGDIVELGWKNANYGHIFTIDRVVSGTAYLVDNSGASVKGGDASDVYVAEQKLSSYAPYINQSTVMVFRANGTATTTANLTSTVLVNPYTNLTVGQSVAVKNLFAATDADNDTISQYMVRDLGANGGYLALNGTKQANGQWVTVNAAQLSQLTYTASSYGSSSETLEIKAFDGKAWGTSDTGRVVSLWDQTNQGDEQHIRSFGVVDKASVATKATEWVGTTDKYDWYTFSVSATSSVDIQLANMTSSVNMWVYNSNSGALVGSAYGYAYNNLSCKLSGTLGAGNYTIRIDQYSGNTDYDLTVGKTGTVASVASGGTTQAIYSGTALKPTQGELPDPLNGTAPSLALADASGLGGGSANFGLPITFDQQNNKGLLAASYA